jgi:hypothetical protein
MNKFNGLKVEGTESDATSLTGTRKGLDKFDPPP